MVTTTVMDDRASDVRAMNDRAIDVVRATRVNRCT